MTLALLLALAPIALLIALGAWLNHSRFLADSFWAQAERLGYYVLLPALFLHGLATASLDNVPVKGMALVLVLSTCAVTVALVASRALLKGSDAAFTSVFQGGIRFNNYVGVSIVAGLFGAQGIALAAVANAAIVPTVNILCVLVLACFGGIALQVLGLGLPVVIEPVLKALGQASLPLGLLCVGAALELGSVRSWVRPVAYSSLAKFVVMPLATVGACHVFGLDGKAAIAAVLFQALPTASSSYIMARQLGGDAPLMAGIVASQTLLAAVTLPLAAIVLIPWI